MDSETMAKTAGKNATTMVSESPSLETLLRDAVLVTEEHFRSWAYPRQTGRLRNGIEPSPFTARHWLTLNLVTRRIGEFMLPDVWPDVEANIERASEVHHTGEPSLFTSWWGRVFRSSVVDKRDPLERIRRIYRTVVDVVLHALAEGELEAVAECRYTRKRFPLESWVWRTKLVVPILYGGVSLIHFKEHRDGFPVAPSDEERSPRVSPIKIWELSLEGDAYILLISRESVERFLRTPEYERLISRKPTRGRKTEIPPEQVRREMLGRWQDGEFKNKTAFAEALAKHYKMSRTWGRNQLEHLEIYAGGANEKPKARK